MNDIPILICHNLKFYMSWMLNKMLNIHCIVAKSHLAFLLRSHKCIFKVLCCISYSHTLTATTRSCFDHNWISHMLSNTFSCGTVANTVIVPRNYRDSRIYHSISCFYLISHFFYHIRLWSYICNIAFFAQLCKNRIFRQKSKSRMDSICS